MEPPCALSWEDLSPSYCAKAKISREKVGVYDQPKLVLYLDKIWASREKSVLYILRRSEPFVSCESQDLSRKGWSLRSTKNQALFPSTSSAHILGQRNYKHLFTSRHESTRIERQAQAVNDISHRQPLEIINSGRRLKSIWGTVCCIEVYLG